MHEWDGKDRRSAKEHIRNILKDAKIVRLERENARLEQRIKELNDALNHKGEQK